METNSIKKLMAYNIRMLRAMRGYTQQDIATRLHKTTNAISNWELGNTSPPVDDLVELCKMFQVTPSQIVGWDECPELIDYITQAEHATQKLEELKKQRDELEEQIKSITELINRKK